MDVDTFYQGSLNAQVRITSNTGKVVTVNVDDMTRPGVESVREICSQDKVGIVTFEDNVTIVVDDDIIVDRCQLVYGGQVVSDKIVPDIHMIAGDSITIDFRLVICRVGNEVII